MNSSIRLEAKGLLSHNIARLFSISFFSFILRYGALICCGYGIFLIYNSTLFKFLENNYSYALVWFIFSLFSVTFSFLTLSFISSIRLGELFAYFTRANGGNGRFIHLFKFLSPAHSIKALVFFLRDTATKLLWWIYFLFPGIICCVSGYFLYENTGINNYVSVILSTGFSLILAISFVVGKMCALRYSAAPYYICLNESITINDAIKKSIRLMDGFLSDGVLLQYSMTGWFLSCIFILPLFYVVPYAKLVRCVYITDVVFSRTASKVKYPINYGIFNSPTKSAYKSTP